MPSGSDSGRVSKATFSASPRNLAEHPRQRTWATLFVRLRSRGKSWAATCRRIAFGAMPPRSYHEAVWEALPDGLEPSDCAGAQRGSCSTHVQAGERVLDLGCGEGRFAAALAQRGRGRAGRRRRRGAAAPRPRARTPGWRLALIACEGAWELPDAGFDVVWAGEVIEHVADTAGWLSEVRRVLRPGGTLLLSTPAHRPLRRLALALDTGCAGAQSRSARRAPALLHPPLAGGTARGLPLRADRDRRRSARRCARGAVLLASAVRSRF